MNSVFITGIFCRKKSNSHIGIILLMMLLSGFIMFSCSRPNDEPEDRQGYYFRAGVDGRKVDFHSVIFQGGGNDNRWEHIVAGGHEQSLPADGSLPSPSLDFEIWKQGSGIKPGTYATPAEEGMIARYAVQTSSETLLYNTSFADDVFEVQIEAISKEGIKGTFSGKLRSAEGKAIQVTEGSFNLPYDTIINP